MPRKRSPSRVCSEQSRASPTPESVCVSGPPTSGSARAARCARIFPCFMSLRSLGNRPAAWTRVCIIVHGGSTRAGVHALLDRAPRHSTPRTPIERGLTRRPPSSLQECGSHPQTTGGKASSLSILGEVVGTFESLCSSGLRAQRPPKSGSLGFRHDASPSEDVDRAVDLKDRSDAPPEFRLDSDRARENAPE